MSDGVWAERVLAAVVEEDRRSRRYSGVVLREARVLDEDSLEFRFTPHYLDGREVALIVDGRQPFAAEFLADGPDDAALAVRDWRVDEVAWRIHLLGMQEPFGAAELRRDAAGRWIRLMTS